MIPDLDGRLTAVLLGTALGDALGLPAEGMSARDVARRFGRLDRFRMLGSVGFVSDDTEQSALLAASLLRFPDDPEGCARDFRRSMLGWVARLPWGVGRGTLRACGRMALGLRPSGSTSAGNGAAMRAAVVGVFHRDRPELRAAFGRALAEVTHRDVRAVEGALYVAEVAAESALGTPPREALRAALGVVEDERLSRPIARGIELGESGADPVEAARTLGNWGYVVPTLAYAAYGFARTSPTVLDALADVVSVGGDADSIGAILGAWLGASRGPGSLPAELIGRIHDGPFGPTHLRGLAEALATTAAGRPTPPPPYSRSASLLRNLALTSVVIGHAVRRLVPF